MATFLRHFNFFARHYEEKTGKKLSVKMHYSVANVPLGGLKIERDPKTGAFDLINPAGYDPNWLGPKMLDFYGNWKSLQKLATLTFEDAQKLTESELNNLGIEKLDEELIKQKCDEALKKQETYLHILRAFAPGLVNMQHPNITLEIKVQP